MENSFSNIYSRPGFASQTDKLGDFILTNFSGLDHPSKGKTKFVRVKG
jgi:hypothetical protein